MLRIQLLLIIFILSGCGKSNREPNLIKNKVAYSDEMFEGLDIIYLSGQKLSFNGKVLNLNRIFGNDLNGDLNDVPSELISEILSKNRELELFVVSAETKYLAIVKAMTYLKSKEVNFGLSTSKMEKVIVPYFPNKNEKLDKIYSALEKNTFHEDGMEFVFTGNNNNSFRSKNTLESFKVSFEKNIDKGPDTDKNSSLIIVIFKSTDAYSKIYPLLNYLQTESTRVILAYTMD